MVENLDTMVRGSVCTHGPVNRTSQLANPATVALPKASAVICRAPHGAMKSQQL